MEIVQKIKHEGEINRARYMPQDVTTIATRSFLPDIFIFNTLKNNSKNSTPQLVLSGHSKEGFLPFLFIIYCLLFIFYNFLFFIILFIIILLFIYFYFLLFYLLNKYLKKKNK